MNAFEKALKKKIADNVADLSAITPGVVVDVHVRGRRKGTLRLGDTYKYYDMASLTKIIFTASYSMGFFTEHPGALTAPVRRALPWWKASSTPQELLTHSAGLAWWKPYYLKLHGPMDPQVRWNQLKKLLARGRPGRKGKSVYSDLDLWLMGSFLEASEEKSLLEMWESLSERIETPNLFFHPRNKPRYSRKLYAPTERCPWRHKVLQGEVHDDNTWALGGVAPHAGLFGPVEAVSDWGLKLRAAVLNDSRRFGDPKMVRKFVKRQIPPSRGDWGLGFMKPTRGKASCGRYFSLDSFGHTGFTGTSLWMDPKHDVLVVILSNRVHPTRDNNSFLALRPKLHDWVCESL